MRGKRGRHSWWRPLLRIIPAHAGQTISLAMPRRLMWDHPRACGANPITMFEQTTDAGIIPAHAGQTVGVGAPCEHEADHPRACGANEDRRQLTAL